MVMEAEFKDTWLSRDLGDEVGAGYLFSRADTDRDGSITEFPDMQRVYSYFDLNGQSWYSCTGGGGGGGGGVCVCVCVFVCVYVCV